jgi:hypothetical protein
MATGEPHHSTNDDSSANLTDGGPRRDLAPAPALNLGWVTWRICARTACGRSRSSVRNAATR